MVSLQIELDVDMNTPENLRTCTQDFSNKQETRIYCRKQWKSFLKTPSPSRLLSSLYFYLSKRRTNSRLLLFIPIQGEELPFLPILKDLNLKFYAPRLLAKHQMEFRHYEMSKDPYASLEKGPYGLDTPSQHSPLLELPLDTEDTVLVPCLGLNSEGIRLGRGGGYYDRFAKSLEKPEKVAVLPYSLSMLSFETQAHDMKINLCITEKGVQKHPQTKPQV